MLPHASVSADDQPPTPVHRSARSFLEELTRARAEDRLEDALDACRKLLALDPDDEGARRAFSEIESVMLGREADELVGEALAHAADGDFDRATRLAEKVERLAPWSPRYLELQVYLDEEGARRAADRLVTTARECKEEGREAEARAALQGALAAMPGHAIALRLLQELRRTGASSRKPIAAAGDAGSVDPDRAEAPESTQPRTEAEALIADALRHFTASEHDQARKAVERALALDPENRRARDLQRILRVLG